MKIIYIHTQCKKCYGITSTTSIDASNIIQNSIYIKVKECEFCNTIHKIKERIELIEKLEQNEG